MAGLLSSSTFLFRRGFPIKEHLLSGQILEFCESEELFPAESRIQINSEEVAASSSNYCCYDDHSASYTSSTLFPPRPADIIKYPASIDNNTADNLFDEEITENDVDINNNSVNLRLADFFNQLMIPPHDLQFDLSQLLQNHIPLTTDHNTITPPYPHQNDHDVVMVCEEEDDCLSSMPPSKLNKPTSSSAAAAAASCSCSFMDPSSSLNNLYLSKPPATDLPPVEEISCSSGIFGGNNLFLQLDFNATAGIFNCPDPPLPTPPYNSNELQALSSNESQHVVNGGGASSSATPITSLEAETYRVASKLTTQERTEKIHRYMKKRNQRNFSKNIKYACRKTLADSRPRVKGRFAKNDEFGEININNRTTSSCNISNNEEDTDEDVKSAFHVINIVKEEEEEEENLESSSSDIFAHISGVNSFKCNYPIQSWI